MPELNANIAELQRIINEELRQSNVFVSRLLDTAEAFSWSDKQTLAQLVVVLGRENNRLQDELLKHEYAKAYLSPVVTRNGVTGLCGGGAAGGNGEPSGGIGTNGIIFDEAKARELLAEFLDGDKLLHPHVANAEQSDFVELNWSFNAEQLEALSWWLRNKQ